MFYLHLSPPTPSTRCTSIQLLLCFCLISCNKYNRSTERLLCTSNQPARAQPRFIATSSQLPITDTIDIDQVLPWPLPGSLLMLLLLGGRCWWWTTTTTRQYLSTKREEKIHFRSVPSGAHAQYKYNYCADRWRWVDGRWWIALNLPCLVLRSIFLLLLSRDSDTTRRSYLTMGQSKGCTSEIIPSTAYVWTGAYFLRHHKSSDTYGGKCIAFQGTTRNISGEGGGL